MEKLRYKHCRHFYNGAGAANASNSPYHAVRDHDSEVKGPPVVWSDNNVLGALGKQARWHGHFVRDSNLRAGAFRYNGLDFRHGGEWEEARCGHGEWEWLVGRLAGLLVGRLAGLLVGRLAGWVAGWVAGWWLTSWMDRLSGQECRRPGPAEG